jgi:NAD(P)-dependent dehydrogenase (short-subunit alcohol dehydrogenase family)
MLHIVARHSNASSSRAVRAALGIAALVMVAGVWMAARAPQDAIAPRLGPNTSNAAGGRTVLITGANRGLGLEFARQYTAAGWQVIGTVREPDQAKELKAIGATDEAQGSVIIVQLDVADPKSVTAMAEALKHQPIDLLINNAGIGSGGANTLADIKPENYERIIQVNAIGPMRVTQALLPNLKMGAGKTIVSITSGLGSITMNTGGRFYGYRESKAALNMFMRTIAAELKGEGFIAIAMSPGWVQTDMGGPNAELTPDQSITGMRKVIDNLKPDDSGKFWNHDGEQLPW